MKRVYPFMLSVFIFLKAMLPSVAFSQCPCSATMPANQITYTATLDSITTSHPVLKFPKFNPSTGTLNCIGMKDTITSILSFQLTNWLHTPFTYQFDYAQYTGFNDGNGLFSSNNVSTTFGPYNLTDSGTVGDSVHVGPDTLYKAATFSGLNSSGNTAPYQSGIPGDSISVTYDNTYSIHYTSSSSAFSLSLLGYARGTFKLTYYWCPSVVLSGSIDGFTAVDNSGTIQLEWTGLNESPNTYYEIEFSDNGQPFQTLGQLKSETSATGAPSKYQYQYYPNQANMGKLYFRLKRTDEGGKITYSPTLTVSNGVPGDGTGNFRAYPNPATNNVLLQFSSNQTGHFLTELISTSGQVLQQKALTLTGTNQIRLDLNPQPPKGLYFLRTTDQSHNQQYISKVFIE